MMENSRRRTRVAAQFEGRLSWGDGECVFTTRNISLKGLLAELSTSCPRPAKDAACLVTMALSAEVVLRIEAEVARIDSHEAALDFTAMDEETYAHLRNLVRFQAQDPDAIDAEQAHKPFLD